MADDVLLDTNVILRLLRADQPSHHAEARRLFEQAREGKLRLLVPTLVVAEVVFVLQGFYRLDRAEISELLRDLVATPNVVLFEAETVVRATEIFGARRVDFVDAYLAALAEETRTTRLATFNKRDFRRFPWLKLIP
jgi:predicted nucleic acid-binding protein